MNFMRETEQYYDWLYKIVCGEWEPRNLSFHRLLMYLFNRDYIPACEMDVCRATDGTTCGTALHRRIIFRTGRSMRYFRAYPALCWR